MKTLYVRSQGDTVESIKNALDQGDYYDTLEDAENDNYWIVGDQDYIIEVVIDVKRDPIHE